MENKEKLTEFLLKARTKTYAGSGGKVRPVLFGSTQLEYREGDWFYRDIYYAGKGIFTGMEVVHFKDVPAWAMSYYGNFKKMTEAEIDKILKRVLMENSQTVRTWKKVEWQDNDYKYVCQPDFNGSIEEMAGMEKISKTGREVYSFFYAGGIIR